MEDKKRFNAADYLGTGSVRESRYCAWYREFDREKFERLFEAAVDDGVPYGYVVNARIGGDLIPAVDFCKYNDYKKTELTCAILTKGRIL